MKASTTLLPKQERFVEEYLLDLNATQAAIRAGYSKATAGAGGAKLLKKVHIATEINRRRTIRTQKTAEIVNALTMDAARTLLENSRIGTFDVRKLYHPDGRMKDIHELDDDTAAAIGGIEMGLAGGGEDGLAVPYLKKLKIVDKGAAIDRAMKHLGLFKLDNEQGVSKAIELFAEMRALVAASALSRQQPVLSPPEQHIHQ